MQQILAPKSPGLPFSEWNLTPLSTSSTLICSTESALLSEKRENDSLSLVYQWIGTVYIRGPFSSVRESSYLCISSLWNLQHSQQHFLKLWSVYRFTLDFWGCWEHGSPISGATKHLDWELWKIKEDVTTSQQSWSVDDEEWGSKVNQLVMRPDFQLR